MLERYEERAYGQQAISEVIRLHAEDLRRAREEMIADGDDAVALERSIQGLFRVWYPELRALFLSISQSRKSRGGKDFELQLRRLLELMEVPYQPPDRTYRVDFMIPSYEHYARNRNQCIVISAKRTLRERWQEVVDELHKMNCPNVYLATADERISADKKDDIWRRNIYLVVWDEVKARYFPADDSVVSYSHLAREVLPHFAKFWPRAKALTPVSPVRGTSPAGKGNDRDEPSADSGAHSTDWGGCPHPGAAAPGLSQGRGGRPLGGRLGLPLSKGRGSG